MSPVKAEVAAARRLLANRQVIDGHSNKAVAEFKNGDKQKGKLGFNAWYNEIFDDRIIIEKVIPKDRLRDVNDRLARLKLGIGHGRAAMNAVATSVKEIVNNSRYAKIAKNYDKCISDFYKWYLETWGEIADAVIECCNKTGSTDW